MSTRTHLKTASIISIIFCVLTLWTNVLAQDSSSNPLDGFTPSGLKRGSPTGTFPLSGFDNVNPYSGNMGFSLPLLQVGGRGKAGYTMQLPINMKWTVTVTNVQQSGGIVTIFEPTATPHSLILPLSPGYMEGSRVGYGFQDCTEGSEEPVFFPLRTLTRLRFIGPDGSSHEFRDVEFGGEPATIPHCPGPSAIRNRKKIFVTNEGESATFISDGNIEDAIDTPGYSQWVEVDGYLQWKDGTTYRIDNGLVMWIRDSNGNKLTFQYGGSAGGLTKVTDSLNREITVEWGVTDSTYGLCDRITYKGFGGTSRKIWITYGSLSSALRSGSVTSPAGLFPELTGASTLTYNPNVVTGIVMPNGKSYQLKYNKYQELARVVLPTGGAYEYDWGGGLTGGSSSGATCACYPSVIYRRMLERRVYPTGGTGSSFESKMTFSRPEDSSGGNLGYVYVNEYDVNSNLLTSKKHYYNGSPLASMSGDDPTAYPPWHEGREYQTDTFASNGTTLLTSEVMNWAQRSSASWYTGNINLAPSADPYVQVITKTLADTNQVSKKTFAVDQFNNQSEVAEYDFGNGTPGAHLRTTLTTFVSSSSYTNNSVHIKNLPSQISIWGVVGGSSIEMARTTFEYDNYTLDGSDCDHSFHCALQSRSSVSGFDSSFNTSYTTRGNPTAVTQHLLVNGSVTGSLTAYSHFDILGNAVRILDPSSTSTTKIFTALDYQDRFGAPNGNAQSTTTPSELTSLSSFGFASKITNALGHIVYVQRDYYLGQTVDGEDPNGFVYSGYFDDSLDRLTQVRKAVGTSLQNQTTHSYDDTNRVITTTADRDTNNDNILVSSVLYDQLGRHVEERKYEGGSNYIAVQTQFDVLGRPYRTSSPFRPWQSESAIWTQKAFDSLSRVTSVTCPGNSVVTTSYSGNAATVTDAQGKQRKQVTDGAGRLIQVYEDPASLNYLTSYDYDALDNLVHVSQGSQHRYFKFDSLKRMIRVRNPEQGTNAGIALSDSITGNGSWSSAYQYDNNGNLTQLTDARGVVSSFTYDVLNRNTGTSYSNDSTGKLPVTRVYDTATNGKGQLHQVQTTGTGGFRSTFAEYDALGRAKEKAQQFYVSGAWGTSYVTTPTYNLAGGVTSLTYPSGNVVNYSYDAMGRLTTFTGNLGVGGTAKNYSTEALYSTFGGTTKEKFGTTTATYNKSFYNSRGQLSEIRVSTSWTDASDTTWNRGAIINFYSDQCWGMCGGSNSTTAMTDNNGNLQKQAIYIPNDDAVTGYHMKWTQNSYDNLNRLSVSREVLDGGTEQWRQTYVYDRYGNRTIDASQSSGGVNEQQFSVDTANNRLGVPNGQSGTMTYDAAGNLTNDTYSGAGSRSFDAENQIVSAWGGNNQAQLYAYDAEGNRISRKVDGVETWQLYGLNGELLAEYAAGGAANSPEKEYGYRNEQLLVTATRRVNVAASANGGTATASQTHSIPYAASGAINGDRKLYTNNAWANSTATFPQWLQVDFNGSKTIDEIDVFSVQNNYTSPVEPTESLTFNAYGVTGFDAQYWTGSAWATVSGGAITGNNKVWKKISFAPLTTTKIRILINASSDSYSRLTEVEAWGPNAGSGATAKLEWLVADQLGSPRMILDESGSLANVKRHDYLPFGEELGTGISGRSLSQGYTGGDGIRQQFASKERDVETGLDYFLSRQYSSTQGRFISPDEPLVGQSATDPQTWNLYSYTSNSPLNRVDEDGQRWFYKCGRDGCDVVWVNPNEDGSYTSPGPGYIEFIPTRLHPNLILYSDDGYKVYRFGEKPDGSPRAFSLWTGKVENKPEHILAMVSAGQTLAAILRGAVASFTAWRTERAIESIVKNYKPNAELGKRVKDVIETKVGRETLSEIEKEAAARWYEKAALQRVTGPKKEAARALNLNRARYLREGGNPPGKIHQYKK